MFVADQVMDENTHRALEERYTRRAWLRDRAALILTALAWFAFYAALGMLVVWGYFYSGGWVLYAVLGTSLALCLWLEYRRRRHFVPPPTNSSENTPV